jgi:hypothetical protein
VLAPGHQRTAAEVRRVGGATRTPSLHVRHVVLQEAVDHHYPVHFAGVSIVLCGFVTRIGALVRIERRVMAPRRLERAAGVGVQVQSVVAPGAKEVQGARPLVRGRVDLARPLRARSRRPVASRGVPIHATGNVRCACRLPSACSKGISGVVSSEVVRVAFGRSEPSGFREV